MATVNLFNQNGFTGIISVNNEALGSQHALFYQSNGALLPFTGNGILTIFDGFGYCAIWSIRLKTNSTKEFSLMSKNHEEQPNSMPYFEPFITNDRLFLKFTRTDGRDGEASINLLILSE